MPAALVLDSEVSQGTCRRQTLSLSLLLRRLAKHFEGGRPSGEATFYKDSSHARAPMVAYSSGAGMPAHLLMREGRETQLTSYNRPTSMVSDAVRRGAYGHRKCLSFLSSPSKIGTRNSGRNVVMRAALVGAPPPPVAVKGEKREPE